MVTRIQRYFLYAVLAAACCHCGKAEESPAPLPKSYYGIIAANVTLEPKSGLPGSTLQATVTVPPSSTAVLSLTFGTQAAVELQTKSNGQASVELTSYPTAGDQVVSVVGTMNGQPVAGHAIYRATSGVSCPDAKTFETGECIDQSSGHPLHPSKIVTVGREASDTLDDRLMQHPRSIVRSKTVLVGCHTDHIGLVALEEMDTVSLPPEVDDDDDAPYDPNIVETLMSEAGLRHCEHLITNESHSVAITASRGTFGEEGGLAVWELGNLESRPIPQAKHAYTVTDPNGFGGIAIDGTTIFAARKPNIVSTFKLNDDRSLTHIADHAPATMRSAGHVALNGSHLYVSDPGRHDDTIETEVTEGPGGTNHLNQVHYAGGGRLFIVDVTDPTALSTLGWADTAGASKGIAVLNNDMIAVATGASGIQLIDVSNPAQPLSLKPINTPTSVNDLSFHGGYLLAADWNSLRLYDASERGTLRLLDGSTMTHVLAAHTEFEPDHTRGQNDTPASQRRSLLGASWVHLDDYGFIVTELDAIILGTVQPGQRGPRFTLHNPQRAIRSSGATWAATVANDGRDTLYVNVVESDHVTSSGPIAIGPGDLQPIEIQVAPSGDKTLPKTVVLQSNDAVIPNQFIQLNQIDASYTVGDEAPSFELPVINECDGMECTTTSRCQSSLELLDTGVPVVLAFFSSW